MAEVFLPIELVSNIFSFVSDAETVHNLETIGPIGKELATKHCCTRITDVLLEIDGPYKQQWNLQLKTDGNISYEIDWGECDSNSPPDRVSWSQALEPEGQPPNADAETTTKPPEPKKCLQDENDPPYVPNLYMCQHNEACCFNEGQYSCCGTDVTEATIREQLILWGVLIGILAVVGIMAACYFTDRYCCDGDPDDENATVCCCFKRKKIYTKKIDFTKAFYPDEHKANQVEDPIFGTTGKPADVPQFASIDTETANRAQYI